MDTCASLKDSSHPIRVLVVDDQPDVLWGLVCLIDSETPRMTVVGTASDIPEALTALPASRPSVVVLDVFLGHINSLDYLPKILEAANAPVLVITSAEDTRLHCHAIQQGAWAVVRKDEPAEVLLDHIEHAHKRQRPGRRP